MAVAHSSPWNTGLDSCPTPQRCSSPLNLSSWGCYDVLVFLREAGGCWQRIGKKKKKYAWCRKRSIQPSAFLEQPLKLNFKAFWFVYFPWQKTCEPALPALPFSPTEASRPWPSQVCSVCRAYKADPMSSSSDFPFKSWGELNLRFKYPQGMGLKSQTQTFCPPLGFATMSQ